MVGSYSEQESAYLSRIRCVPSDLAHRKYGLGLAYCSRNGVPRKSVSLRVNSSSVYADQVTPIPQLIQRRAKEGRLSSHALVSIVRLTVETNIMTSKSPEF